MMVQFAVGNLENNDPIASDRSAPDTQAEQPASYFPSYPAGT
jgi:hypothetical protein